jgi:energy-coupling factor transport system permease protein
MYHFDRRDKKALAVIVGIGAYIIVGSVMGGLYFRYFPTIKGELLNPVSISLFIAYVVLCLTPVVIDREEEQRWIASQSNI